MSKELIFNKSIDIGSKLEFEIPTDNEKGFPLVQVSDQFYSMNDLILDSQTKERSEGVILTMPLPPSQHEEMMSKQQAIAELDLARSTLSKAKSQLTSATYTKASTQSYLDNEALLLQRIETAQKM